MGLVNLLMVNGEEFRGVYSFSAFALAADDNAE
jgi:hypothetical protein